MPAERTCIECLEPFDYKGGSLCCSDECKEFHEIRMRESYNVLKRLMRLTDKQLKSGELTKEECTEMRNKYWAERHQWLKDKTITTEIQWRGESPYPNDSIVQEEE